jgi:hypothetical protein
MNRSTLAAAALLAGALTLACDSSESTAAEDHTPVRVELAVNGTAMTTDTLFLPAGQTVTVRVTFFNAADDNLDDVEGEHYSLLTFNPGTLATATADAAHHYSHSVVVQAAAATIGTVDIGFGHDALADENTLSGVPVKVQ